MLDILELLRDAFYLIILFMIPRFTSCKLNNSTQFSVVFSVRKKKSNQSRRRQKIKKNKRSQQSITKNQDKRSKQLNNKVKKTLSKRSDNWIEAGPITSSESIDVKERH